MKIDRVTVAYSELRTTIGYNNVRHGIELSATLEPGETAALVKTRLQDIAVREVKKAFGDNINQTEMDLPF